MITISSQGGELPYEKDRGASQKFWEEPLRGNEILFCRRGLEFLSPQEVPILKQHIMSCHIFGA